jgi:tRNA modification GTPase
MAPARRQVISGAVHMTGVAAPLPGDLHLWPGPRSYTGQDVAELHLLSCPPLVDLLVGDLLRAGARAACAGEFTLRAFLAGKMDLPRAEAVLAVIESGSRDELRQALKQQAGAVTQPLAGLRDDLLNLLADVEAGLDFSEEDLQFVDHDSVLTRLAKGLALVTLVRKSLEERAVVDRRFRVVLAGPPNAGKSCLFNALIGHDIALVSSHAGTTRDYLVHRLDLDGVGIDLVDTAGLYQTVNVVETEAQHLGREQGAQGDLVLWCQAADEPNSQAAPADLDGVPVVALRTKCDLDPENGSLMSISALRGDGLDRLRQVLAERARSRRQGGLAPSLSRCRHHVDAGLDHLRRAHAAALYFDPPEILALELRSALEELGALVGAVYTDDLLDRIFSRFCIGK